MKLLGLKPYELYTLAYDLRILRTLKINYTLFYLQELFIQFMSIFSQNLKYVKGFARIIKFFLLLMMTANFIACIWYYLGNITEEIEMVKIDLKSLKILDRDHKQTVDQAQRDQEIPINLKFASGHN